MANKIDALFNRNQADVARLLTDTDYLMQMRAAAQALNKNTPGRINLSGVGLPFANIAGPKTSTEKGIVGKYVHNMNNSLRGTSVFNPKLGKEIHFNPRGLNKANNTIQENDKAIMLNQIQKLAENGTPYQSSKTYGRNKYDYLMTPVSIDGRNMGAAITLRNNYLYNVNPFDYAIKANPNNSVNINKNPSGVVHLTKMSQPKDTNSIAEYLKNVKALRNAGKRSVKDVLINTARPAYVGQTAEILRRNKRKEK